MEGTPMLQDMNNVMAHKKSSPKTFGAAAPILAIRLAGGLLTKPCLKKLSDRWAGQILLRWAL